MVITKKIKDLTGKELDTCGWIERIAYRGDSKWIMYDFETRSFSKIRSQYRELYDELTVTMGHKWFVLYKEEKGMISLIDMAKMDIGKGQEDTRRQIQDFTREMIDSGKFIFAIARKDTSYYTYAKAAADGEIEIYKDDEHGAEMRDMIFVKAEEGKDLGEQKEKYRRILEEFRKNKEQHKESRRAMLEHYIAELEADIGVKAVDELLDR